MQKKEKLSPPENEHWSSKSQLVSLLTEQSWLIYLPLENVKQMWCFLPLYLLSAYIKHICVLCLAINRLNALTLPSSTNVVISPIASDNGRKIPIRLYWFCLWDLFSYLWQPSLLYSSPYQLPRYNHRFIALEISTLWILKGSHLLDSLHSLDLHLHPTLQHPIYYT